MIRIDQKIVSQEVVKNEPPAPAPEPLKPYERPAEVSALSYKITPSTMNAALYVIISDIVLEDGTRRPIEIFLVSKDNAHHQWMTGLTRVISGHFRQRSDFLWLIDELKEVTDTNGSYYRGKSDPTGTGRVNSIVAHIGLVLEKHCKKIGLIKVEEVTKERRKELEEKAVEAQKRGVPKQVCPKCAQESMVMLDGCYCCVSCGESKCA